MRPVRTVRSWATWALGHGVSRGFIQWGARRGDLIARLTADPALRDDPFAAYDELRETAPVVHGRVISATTQHAAATEILRSDAFGVGAGHGELPPVLNRLLDKISDPWALGPVDPPSMLATDPPDHTRYRRLVSRAFSARAVASTEPQVRKVADRLLDDLAGESGGFDLVERYAALLPVVVIADLLGVPEDMHGRLLEWGNGAAVTLDPGLSWRQYRAAESDVRHLHGWFAAHVAELRRHPGDDLLSRLAVLEGEDRLTDVELHATGLLVLGAGFETTVNLIGNAVVQLARHPEQLEVVRDDPSAWAGAVEEVLRHDSPVQLTLRQAYADREVSGVPVPKGTPVLVMIGGANRDPVVFDDPHRFDVRRLNAGDHLAFSSGAHYCLGASLARLEAKVALQALYERFPDLTLAGRPTRRGTRVLRGYERLPVTSGGLSRHRVSTRPSRPRSSVAGLARPE